MKNFEVLRKIEKLEKIYKEYLNIIVEWGDLEKKAKSYMGGLNNEKEYSEFLKRFKEEQKTFYSKIKRYTNKIEYLTTKVNEEINELLKEKRKCLDYLNSEDVISNDVEQNDKINNRLVYIDFTLMRANDIYQNILYYKNKIESIPNIFLQK